MHNGFLFYRHYLKDDKVYWRCRQVTSTVRCPARLCISDKIVELNQHNHDTSSLTRADAKLNRFVRAAFGQNTVT
jgi:FLYWCH zinc finger domain